MQEIENATHKRKEKAISGLPPFLRWAGSKRKLLPKLRKYWKKEHKRYIEPFAGSACLYFALKPRRAILGDLNKNLIDTFRAIKKSPITVYKNLRKLKNSRTEYMKIRDESPNGLTRSQKAAHFIYLNRYCFNGIYRTNLKGKFNVPYAPSGTGQLPSRRELISCSKQLQGTRLLSKDFLKTTRLAKRGDFLYLDPPYSVENRRIFKEYGKEIFSNEQLRNLKQELKRLDQLGADFVVSYADSTEGRNTLKGWNLKRVRTRRNVAGFTNKRNFAYELIATNIHVN
jgi:DNA adenine methylase